ncbi:MAG: hypothetical protein IIC09_04735, partial [Proteobacteria bacterium]|nr:hypothetical protein [Pseudomonadota bacterium]
AAGTITEISADDTDGLSAPSGNPRFDIVYIDEVTGALAVATGAEAGSPVDPTIPAGKIPITRINWTVGMGEITNADLDDIRPWLITGESIQTIHNTHAKIGATAGWVINAADDIGLLGTVPAGATANCTLIVPIAGLVVGDTITAFSVVGQIESAGETVLLDANLRKHTAAAADVADASVDSIAQISQTADYEINDSKTGLTEVVAANETFYVLLTADTGPSASDIALQAVTITVKKP